ncbi:hypothetical protein CPB84DRAFT_1846154 [Gymnopilus junonius]|uniref:Uncharacterized protein n=1 Tax=Gymnopilus junonius TaxID=109634 RepID=A0A9P5NQD2_GYMJU|nr:hypothetical protein CPB84DRAFT_1846154 [Gymnopilus junonius]
MRPKPTFKVKLSMSRRKSNLEAQAPTMDTWMLAGSEEDRRLRAKVQRDGSFDKPIFIERSRLRDWNINTRDVWGEGTSNAASITHVMPPVSETPHTTTGFESLMTLSEGPLPDTVDPERDERLTRQSPSLCPPQQPVLISPSPLIARSREPSPEESEVAYILLSLLGSSPADK